MEFSPVRPECGKPAFDPVDMVNFKENIAHHDGNMRH
jgi:hypothetical protein